jgi:hypothetical protein
MIKRLSSVWLAIAGSASVSFVCYILAGEVGRPILYREVCLPLISRIFYPDSLLVYLYPIPLVIWALIHTLRSPYDHNLSHLIVTATYSTSILFIVVFALAIVFPFIPGAPSVLR